MASGVFRFMGGLSRNMIIPNTCKYFALLMIMVLGGFIITRVEDSARIQRAIRSASLRVSWSLSGNKMVLDWRGRIGGICVLIQFLIHTMALTYLDSIGKSQTAMSEETLKEKDANIPGEISKPSSGGKSIDTHSAS